MGTGRKRPNIGRRSGTLGVLTENDEVIIDCNSPRNLPAQLLSRDAVSGDVVLLGEQLVVQRGAQVLAVLVGGAETRRLRACIGQGYAYVGTVRVEDEEGAAHVDVRRL
jgi:vacuolar-type H+-ATPase subunit E/Vma4